MCNLLGDDHHLLSTMLVINERSLLNSRKLWNITYITFIGVLKFGGGQVYCAVIEIKNMSCIANVLCFSFIFKLDIILRI